MSKKMVKRSLALGALMAFVITGSAMAAELTINYENGNYSVVGTEIGGELSEVYSSLQEADIAGEMSPYVTKKNSNKTNVEPGKGLIGGTWTGTTVKAIGMFVDKYNGNKVSLNYGAYNGPYRIYGASNYDEGQEESTSNANGNVVNVQNVTMDFAESQYPGVTGGWSWNDANNNSITIEDSTLNKTLVYGGDAQFGDANNNTITVKNSTVGYINGGTTRYDGYDAIGNGKGNANNNKVFVDDSTVVNSFKGGSAGGYGNANGNYIEVTNLEFTGDAIDGGFAECGNVENNKIVINGDETKITGLVYGGRSQDKGNAIGNEVVINAGTFTNAGIGIAGGITENENTFDQGYEGDANQNTVIINNATINAQVSGGYSKKGSANENIVEITGGSVTGNVFGGYGGVYVKKNANGTTAESAHGNALGNMVSVIDVDVDGRVTGGCAHNSFEEAGEAKNNKVYVENSNITGQVIGGETSRDLGVYGHANNNEVKIINSTVGKYVQGGSSAAEGNANQNKVMLTNIKMTGDGNVFVAGGQSSWGDASENTVIIDGSETELNVAVYGGVAQANGSAIKNNVSIKDGAVKGSVYGGWTIHTNYKDWSTVELSQANENIVMLEGANITGNVYGGSADRTISGFKNTANNNIVSIIDSTVVGNVYGGFVKNGEANDNTVNISGTANVTNASLFGSNLTTSTGNTLNIGEGWKGSAKSVQNFNTVNFSKGSAITVTDGMTLANDATLNLADGNDYTDTNYAITGELNTGDNATLTIGNIKETTYNIASAYDSETEWKLVNDLMEVESWNTNGQLQVTVKAQSASDIADNLGVSEGTGNLINGIITADNPNGEAVNFVENIMNSGAPDDIVKDSLDAAQKMAEAGGQSATAARIVNNVTGVTNDRLSFNCGHSAPHKGGHGVGLFEEGSGADIWVEYVHGKDKVEDMPSTAGASSYEGQFNGIVMGVDFKRVNKFQSGFAFNYGEGDTNSVGSSTRTHSDYDFWGIGYYGNIHNDDSNVIFDISYGKTDSDVTQTGIGGVLEAAPETTTWSAGVKVEKLYQNENVQIVPYTGLRFMSINTDDYATKGEGFMYNMDRQNIWLLPVGVSIKQEVANDNGWTVSPRVDLSYIWAFGDTNSDMEVKSGNGISPIGYDVMDDGSFLGLVGIEAHKGQWGYGVSYSYQKGDHSESKKWYVDVNYTF